MTSTAPISDRRPGIASALTALVVLAALVVVPPLGLITAVGNPIPEHLVIGGRFTDDAVIAALAVVVWLAWAQLMLVIAVEAVAAVRGRGVPRFLPGCSVQQQFARHLVLAACVLLTGLATTATAGAATAPATGPTCATAPPTIASEVPSVRAALSESPAPTATATVTRVVPPPVAAAAPVRERWYVVAQPHGHHHDSLWDIAERHLGGGLRWREIYELNHHRPQPAGQQLDLARLIQPGWRLLMPADATGLPDHHEHNPRSHRPPNDAADVHSATDPYAASIRPAGRETPDADAPSHETLPDLHPGPAVGRSAPAGTSAPVQPAASPNRSPVAPIRIPAPSRPSGQSVSGPVAGARTAVADDDDDTVPFGGLTLGLGALAAAGVCAELSRRRRRARRTRRFGQRLPRPSEQAASLERRIGTANAEITVTAVREALQRLAANCRAAGRALPDLHTMRLNAHRMVLTLGRDDPSAVAPFTARDPRNWTLDLPAPHTGGMPVDDEDPVDPYPALVAIGVSEADLIVVNLEAAGTLTVAAEPAAALAILAALTVELGTGLLSASTQLVLTDCPPQLPGMLDPGRVRVLDPPAAKTWATTTSREIGKILHAADLPDLQAARAAGQASDLWAPSVLVIGPNAERRSEQPGPGVSVIRVGDPKPNQGWELRHDDAGWTLHPHGLRLHPQALDPATLHTLADAMSTADGPAIDPGPPPAMSSARATTPDPAGLPAPVDIPAQVLQRPPASVPVTDQEPEEAPTLEPRAIPGGATYSPPRVLVLGAVEIAGADAAPIERRGKAVEVTAFLALHPAATRHHFDEAIWPGLRVKDSTRDSLISRARQWLGTNPDGQYHLPHVTQGGTYRLSPDVTCDWTEFCALSARGLAAGPDRTDDLIAAVELVRGRPFLGVNPTRYLWAEAGTQDMICKIVDAAHALATRALAAGDYRRARWAATKGLEADSCSELLYRDAIRAAAAAGDHTDLDRLVGNLRRQLELIDPEGDVSEETVELLAMVAAR